MMEVEDPIVEEGEVEGELENKELAVVELKCHYYKEHMLVSIRSPPLQQREPADICCVIDISGSMSTEVKLRTATTAEKVGLSQLDLVKHAVRTVIASLDANDRLSIVTFSDDAEIVVPLTHMTTSGKKKAGTALEKLHPTNSTNLWAGLQKGLSCLAAAANDDSKDSEGARRNSAVFLLTDGEPNVHPPRGYTESLKRYRMKTKSKCIVDTFGFGYKLDSLLLESLAVACNGSFAFIPDASFVGTIFINALSNLLTCSLNNLKMKIQLQTGAESDDFRLLQHFRPQLEPDCSSVVLQLGSLHSDQSRDIVFRCAPSDQLDVKLMTPSGSCSIKVEVNQDPLTAAAVVMPQLHRLQCVSLIRNVLLNALSSEKREAARAELATTASDLKESEVAAQPYVADLMKDMSGQVMESLENKFYDSWGKHFLRSISQAHALQLCNNFKDPGVQHYGSQLFQTIRDQLDDLFSTLPPPKPSIKSAAARPVSSMKGFHNSRGVCIAGKCLVKMADGSSRKVEHLKPGDVVYSSSSHLCEESSTIAARIKYVVRTPVDQDQGMLMVSIGELLLTPWHPVFISGQWKFPEDVAQPFVCRDIDAVYNFVLEEGHVMSVEGVSCITMGHHYQDPVLSHPYFGSEAVVEDLAKLDVDGSGYVQLGADHSVVRDDKSGLIVGVRLAPAALAAHVQQQHEDCTACVPVCAL